MSKSFINEMYNKYAENNNNNNNNNNEDNNNESNNESNTIEEDVGNEGGDEGGDEGEDEEGKEFTENNIDDIGDKDKDKAKAKEPSAEGKSFLNQIIGPNKKESTEMILNIHYKSFSTSSPPVILKKEESLIRYIIGQQMQKRRIKFKSSPDMDEPNFFIIVSKEQLRNFSDIYSVVQKTSIELEDGIVKNIIYILLEEAENNDDCKPFKSTMREIKIVKLYVKNGDDKDGRKSFFDCTSNKMQLDIIFNSMQNFYELKLKELESIELIEEGKNNNNSLEEVFEEKEPVIDEKLHSQSIISITNINETSRLSLKDPSQKIRLLLSSFNKFMRVFPQQEKMLCPAIMNIFKERKNLFIETERAIYLDASVTPIGSKDSDFMYQYITQVYNHHSLKHIESWTLFEKKKGDVLKNKLGGNILKKYLIGREFMKEQTRPLDVLLGFNMSNNQCYPTYPLEDILLPLIGDNNEKINVLIPFITKVNILDDNMKDNINKTKNTTSTLYLVSYLYYSNMRIYLYPLYFIDSASNTVDLSERMRKIKKNIIQDIQYYFTELIKSSILYEFTKIQFGGVINGDIESIELSDLNFQQNQFFTVFFQLFYTLMNLEKKPDEILNIFGGNDLIDHYYIFLQFIQESC